METSIKQIDAVIFDMDGLMFDTETLAEKCWEKAGRKYGYTISKKIYKQVTGLNLARSKEIFLNHYGADFPFDTVRNERIRLSNEEIISNGVPVKKGLFELLDFLKSKRIKTGLATSTEKQRVFLMLEQSKTKEYFHSITCGDEVTRGKPDPEIFLTTASKLNAHPAECIVLEDSIHGIEAAFNAGMIPFMVPDTIMPDDELKQKAFRIFESLTEVKKYLYSLDSPA
jgi:HAD superfamily hydrolase (TIGR01509 family)